MNSSRSLIAKVGAAALVLAAAGTASVAQARSNVHFSIHGAVAPGVMVSASNAPYYYDPQPLYLAPQPYYYEPVPVYYAPRVVYVRPAPVYYGHRYYSRTHVGHRHGGHRRHR